MSGIHTDPLDSYNEGRIEQPLGVYSPADGTYIVDIYKDRPPADMVIKFDCPYDDFIALWLDGELLRRDEHLHVGGGDYYAEEGSTVVTVYGQTLGRLDPDLDHVIAAEFKEGGRVNGRQYKVAQNFRINRAVPEPKKVVHWYRVLRNEAYEKLEKLSDKDFKQITGVSRKVFCRMLEVLRRQYSEDHRQGGQLGLPVELRLTLALEYWREYRVLLA